MANGLFCVLIGGILALGLYLVVSGWIDGDEKGAMAMAGTPCIVFAASMIALRFFC